jgi:hypothetical protein
MSFTEIKKCNLNFFLKVEISLEIFLKSYVYFSQYNSLIFPQMKHKNSAEYKLWVLNYSKQMKIENARAANTNNGTRQIFTL